MSYLIQQMGHIVISSPIRSARRANLMETVGLRITQQDADAVYLSSNTRHHEVTYVRALARRLWWDSRRSASKRSTRSIAGRSRTV